MTMTWMTSEFDLGLMIDGNVQGSVKSGSRIEPRASFCGMVLGEER